MSTAPSLPSRRGEPAWEIARMFPEQGAWSEEDYFALSDRNWLVEYDDGCVEVLPMPDKIHQMIANFLLFALRDYRLARGIGGLVMTAPFRIRVSRRQYREPDLVYFAGDHEQRVGRKFAEGAELVVEIVSESNRDHDEKKKRREYARAGIPEYWMVDPENETITVLVLEAGATRYSVRGVYGVGERASSLLLPGFEVDVAEALAGAT